jgi:hypothetical protein
MPQSIPTLQELAFMYSTDKLDHGYIPFYEEFLPKNPKKILEIGIKEGRSAQMWLKYFPETIFHGLDLFKENPVPFQHERAVWHQGNQCDYLLLEKLRNEDFDIIIDDGSHNARDQMITFFGLFNGKEYFIEDIHCPREDFYRQGLPVRFTADQIFDDVKGRKDWYETFLPSITKEGNIILIKCS